ncbi:MAG: DUF2937 family protein [Pseudomonadota bacterium]|jgi:hypothetical protein
MKLVTGLLDRLLFAAGLVAFLQIPQFIDHYTQRFAGYRQALAASVAEYQRSADLHYGGNLDTMIQDFRTDPKPALRETGDKIHRESRRLDEMTEGLKVLRAGPLHAKLWYLVRDIDVPIARATLEDFRPGLPLTLEALAWGLVGGVLASLLFNLLVWPLRRVAQPQRELRI